MLILVIFALQQGMIWVALGVGLLMVLVSTSEGSGKAKDTKMFYPSPDQGVIGDTKEQMLKVMYAPGWDGNSWWEEMPDHIGMGLSDKPGDSRYHYCLQSRADDLAALLDHLGLVSEKVPGEWNSVDVVCRGATIQVSINGVFQNRITHCDPREGRVGIQLKGFPFELRNLRLTPID